MTEKMTSDEEQFGEAYAQGERLGGLLEQMHDCDLDGGDDAALRRQEAFVRALLESEERKSEAQEAMELEQEKVRSVIAQLEKMTP